MNKIKMNLYLATNNGDTKYIRNYCKVQLEHNDLIRPKSLMFMLSKKYAMFEVMQYIKNDLHIPEDKIFYGKADYIVTLPRGHMQLTNDLYFDRCYLHQLVIYHELGIDMEQVQKYFIHHISLIKDDNSIKNLWIFYDCASHIKFHQKLKHNPSLDIEKFTRDYIEKITNKDNAGEVQKYLEILNKLIAKKRTLENTLI